jgi:hypothetical protein
MTVCNAGCSKSHIEADISPGQSAVPSRQNTHGNVAAPLSDPKRALFPGFPTFRMGSFSDFRNALTQLGARNPAGSFRAGRT